MSNVANRTIFIRDNLEVMRGINSASVALIYLDSPFNSKRMFEAPIGSQDADANLQLLCGWCNRTKGARSNEHLRERVEQAA